MGEGSWIRHCQGAPVAPLRDLCRDREAAGRQNQVRGGRDAAQVRGALRAGPFDEGNRKRSGPARQRHRGRGLPEETRQVSDDRQPDQVLRVQARDHGRAVAGRAHERSVEGVGLQRGTDREAAQQEGPVTVQPESGAPMANETSSPRITNGFHLIVDALKLNGLDTIFGVAGIPVTDLARLAQAEGIRYIGFQHEQSAGNAAAIAGFITRTPGICLTVSAPRFLNGMVALANATTNGFPMIQISGSSDRAIVDLQQGDYEELDQMNAAKPYARAAYRVNRPEDIGIGLARAIRAAVSGRPGGVYLDLPASVLGATLDAETGARSLVRVVDPTPRQLPAPESVRRALQELAQAERPLIILGKGAAYAQADADIRAFVDKTGILFVPMSMAKGLLPDDHPQSAAAARSHALAKADVVMLIGARLNWLLGHGRSPQWSPTAQFVQLDIAPTEMDSNRAIAAPVVGDIASSVSALLARLKPGQIRARASWLDALAQDKRRNADRMASRLAANPDPMEFYSALGAIKGVLADKDVYLVNEGANTLDIARNVIDMRLPRRRLDTGTWGVMGIGMGYAIGAAVVSGKPVVA